VERDRDVLRRAESSHERAGDRGQRRESRDHCDVFLARERVERRVVDEIEEPSFVIGDVEPMRAGFDGHAREVAVECLKWTSCAENSEDGVVRASGAPLGGGLEARTTPIEVSACGNHVVLPLKLAHEERAEDAARAEDDYAFRSHRAMRIVQSVKRGKRIADETISPSA